MLLCPSAPTKAPEVYARRLVRRLRANLTKDAPESVVMETLFDAVNDLGVDLNVLFNEPCEESSLILEILFEYSSDVLNRLLY